MYTSWERNDETDLSKHSIAVNMQAYGPDTSLGKALVIRFHAGILWMFRELSLSTSQVDTLHCRPCCHEKVASAQQWHIIWIFLLGNGKL